MSLKGKKKSRTFKGHFKFAHKGLREPLFIVGVLKYKTGKYTPAEEDRKHEMQMLRLESAGAAE